MSLKAKVVMKRGDLLNRIKSAGRRVPMSARGEHGFSLIELVITVTVMTILTLGVMPLVKVAVRRQREQQLRETLRQIRFAIDEFHRDTAGLNCSTAGLTGNNPNQPQVGPVDPRSRVMISDCTIFGVDNPDRYPPTLQTLIDGVSVIPRGVAAGAGGKGLQSTGTQMTNTNSQLDSQLATKTKVYLRALPIDPMTGKADWDIRSCYDASDSTSWGGENVFDVRSKSRETALNGEKYSDW
ncbi:MAG TPA: type II secretion system protein [Pyrinomonadaceae bacterium]